MAEEEDGLAPQYCRPGGPAIANHLIRHDVHDHVSRRLRISLPLPQQSCKLQEESNSLVLVGRHPRMALASARCPNKSTTDTDNDHWSRQFYPRGSR